MTTLATDRKLTKLAKELKQVKAELKQLRERDNEMLIEVLQAAMADYLDKNVSFDINDIKESREWPGEDRIDVIGSNGDNNGLPHYFVEQAG